MKRCLLALLLSVAVFALPAAALSPGEMMGDVLYTDIVATINGVPIPSYNIGGNTYIVAEDLADYGFWVSWDPRFGDGMLTVTPRDGVVRADYTSTPSRHRPGTVAMPYLCTRVLTWLGSEPVWAANIGGRTCVAMDDLAAFFGEHYVWDADARELRLTLREGAAFALPDSWSYTYETPGYDKDRAVSGEYAMWEFAREGDGFALTDAAGATDFTPQLTLSGDRVSYRVHFEQKRLGRAGENVFTSAPHGIEAHTRLYRLIGEGQLFTDWNTLSPAHYRAYLLQNREKAAQLEALAVEAGKVWRVYVNGEPIAGIPATESSSYYSTLVGAFQSYREMTYFFDRRIPADAVETVRIELGEIN